MNMLVTQNSNSVILLPRVKDGYVMVFYSPSLSSKSSMLDKADYEEIKHRRNGKQNGMQHGILNLQRWL